MKDDHESQVKSMNEQFEMKIEKKEADHAKVLEQLALERQKREEEFSQLQT